VRVLQDRFAVIKIGNEKYFLHTEYIESISEFSNVKFNEEFTRVLSKNEVDWTQNIPVINNIEIFKTEQLLPENKKLARVIFISGRGKMENLAIVVDSLEDILIEVTLKNQSDVDRIKFNKRRNYGNIGEIQVLDITNLFYSLNKSSNVT
jgi:hypothetical protein